VHLLLLNEVYEIQEDEPSDTPAHAGDASTKNNELLSRNGRDVGVLERLQLLRALGLRTPVRSPLRLKSRSAVQQQPA
jgi:hypothetical protein